MAGGPRFRLSFFSLFGVREISHACRRPSIFFFRVIFLTYDTRECLFPIPFVQTTQNRERPFFRPMSPIDFPFFFFRSLILLGFRRLSPPFTRLPPFFFPGPVCNYDVVAHLLTLARFLDSLALLPTDGIRPTDIRFIVFSFQMVCCSRTH